MILKTVQMDENVGRCHQCSIEYAKSLYILVFSRCKESANIKRNYTITSSGINRVVLQVFLNDCTQQKVYNNISLWESGSYKHVGGYSKEDSQYILKGYNCI